MEKRWRVSGTFSVEVEGDGWIDVRRKAERILTTSGIDGYVVNAEEVKTDE